MNILYIFQLPTGSKLLMGSMILMVHRIYLKADATFGNGATEYQLSKEGLPYMENAFSLNNSLDLAFAVRKDWPEAISIINKGLAEISEYEMVHLKQKWFSPSKNIDNNKMEFSDKESKYLRDKKSLNVCIDPNWFPLEALENGKYIGISADYMKLFSEKIGMPINLVKTDSWSQSLEKIQKRECDILSLAEKTPNRIKYLDFTTPYIKIPLVIVTKTATPFIVDIKNVLNKTFAVVKDYTIIKKLKTSYPSINIREVDSIDDGLEKLKNDEVFGYIDNSMVANSYIQDKYLGILSISGQLKENTKLSIATRNDEVILNRIFQKILYLMDSSTKQKILNQWIKNDSIRIDYTLVWQIVVIAGFIILIFLYRQYYIRKLNKELQLKIKKELKKSSDKDKMIFEQSKFVAMGEMIENIAHQWRQPLSQINSVILLMDMELSKNRLKNRLLFDKLDEIETLTHHMSKTIDDFRNFYKKDKIKEIFNLELSIQKTVSLVEASFKYNNIGITLNIDKDISIKGYQNDFQQAILVMLNNARDALLLSAIDNPRILIKSVKDSENIILFIQDNAFGIKDEIISKIFDPYFTTKHQSQGTGLGLYLSKKILKEKMNAKLYVKNVDGGACFFIEFSKESILMLK